MAPTMRVVSLAYPPRRGFATRKDIICANRRNLWIRNAWVENPPYHSALSFFAEFAWFAVENNNHWPVFRLPLSVPRLLSSVAGPLFSALPTS
jgi:hypothetical protein